MLLEVLAENQVSIPELGTITSKNDNLTVLTSNATRELSEALRRRCLYFYLDSPSVDIETKVILNNVENIDEEKAKKFSIFSNFVRSLGLNKPPSLIESVEWVKYYHLNDEESLNSNIGILIKDIEDQVEKYGSQMKKAGLVSFVLTQIWNKQGKFRLGSHFSYRDEKAFVACQKILNGIPQDEDNPTVTNADRGIVLLTFGDDQ